jgi:CrcB protein
VTVAASDVSVLAAICIGGAAGALARYQIELAWPAGAGIPRATLAINWSGAFLLGVLVSVVVARLVGSRRRLAPLVRPALGTGLLGGYTTFSTVMVEARDRALWVSAAYLALSVIGGLALAAAGLRIGARLAGPPRPGPRRGPPPVDPDLP